jgi:quinol monooxygenase YgiN
VTPPVGAPRRVLVVTVRMCVKPEKRDEFIQAMTDLTARTRQAVGCVASHFYADGEDPDAFTLVEEWRRWRDLDRHLTSDEFAGVIGAGFLLSGPAEITLDLASRRGGTDEVLRRRADAGRPGR